MAAENSFDVACKIDMQEVTNAIDQARRDIATRYDLKGAKNEIEIEKMDITISSTDDMKVKAVLDILQSKLHRRGIDLKALTINDPEQAGGGLVRQKITLQDGVPMEKAKEIVRLIKDSKIRVQASIQEKQVRVAGKNRDDLQAVIALLKGKDLLVGVIDVASEVVETPEEVERTILQALEFVPAERLFPCTNCGMAPMDREVAIAKLKALGAGAALARSKLAGRKPPTSSKRTKAKPPR